MCQLLPPLQVAVYEKDLLSHANKAGDENPTISTLFWCFRYHSQNKVCWCPGTIKYLDNMQTHVSMWQSIILKHTGSVSNKRYTQCKAKTKQENMLFQNHVLHATYGRTTRDHDIEIAKFHVSNYQHPFHTFCTKLSLYGNILCMAFIRYNCGKIYLKTQEKQITYLGILPRYPFKRGALRNDRPDETQVSESHEWTTIALYRILQIQFRMNRSNVILLTHHDNVLHGYPV